MRYFDAHAHIQFPEFAEDREVLIDDMQVRGIGGIVVGVDYGSSQEAVSLVSSMQNHDLYAAVGLHPNYTAEEEFALERYRALAQHDKVVAIGECGLDYFRPEDAGAAKPRQLKVLEQHIALAAATKKPLMIHARPSKGTQDAYHDLVRVVAEAKAAYGDQLSAHIHFFVGGVDQARLLIDLGCTVSYTAVLCFARDYDEVVRFLPLEAILTETDSPYAAPPPHRGKRNDPRAVESVVEVIASIRGESYDLVREQVLANAKRVFSLP